MILRSLDYFFFLLLITISFTPALSIAASFEIASPFFIIIPAFFRSLRLRCLLLPPRFFAATLIRFRCCCCCWHYALPQRYATLMPRRCAADTPHCWLMMPLRHYSLYTLPPLSHIFRRYMMMPASQRFSPLAAGHCRHFRRRCRRLRRHDDDTRFFIHAEQITLLPFVMLTFYYATMLTPNMLFFATP